MITGFNTDIKHRGAGLSRQTEDRGTLNPVVESLVYVGGEILLSKKSPYRDLIQSGRIDEQAVRQIMDGQHRSSSRRSSGDDSTGPGTARPRLSR